MGDIDLLVDFLGMVGVAKKDIGLVAEMIHTIDRLVSINEQDLQGLKWPEKTGEERPLLTSAKINALLVFRERLLVGTQNSEERAQKLREYLTSFKETEQLSDFLKVFLPNEAAAHISASIASLSNWIDLYSRGELEKKLKVYGTVVALELVEVTARALSTGAPIDALCQLAQDCEGYGLLVALALYANRLTSKYADFNARKFTLKNGSITTVGDWKKSEDSIKASLTFALGGRSVPEEAYMVAKRAYYVFTGDLFPQERRVVYVFAGAVRKVLTESVPKYLREAVRSSHPFLLRPLFRSYPSALTYAIGGKVASSLETIWGDVGEELFLAMGDSLRPVRNGGIDVVYGRDAYDIKSGPAVMNRDQISVLHIKQRIISQEKRVPGLDTFRIALVYGRSSDMFGTMASDLAQGNILDARSAWGKLTGDSLAPERVYALAGLVADIIGVPGAIEAASIDTPEKNTVLDQDPSVYDDEFGQIFANAFDPPTDKPESSIQRLEKIELLDASVRDLLKN